MNFRQMMQFAPVVLGLIVPTAGNAITIDFNSLPPALFLSAGNEIVTQGSTFQINGPFGNAFVSPGGSSLCSPDCANNGTNYLFSTGHLGYKMSRGGEAFDLLGFDAAEAHEGITDGWAKSIVVVGTKSDLTTVTASFDLDFIQDGDDPLNDFQSFVLPASFTDLISVQFDPVGNVSLAASYGLDNIALRVAAVPLPATISLFCPSLIAIVLFRRRMSPAHKVL